MLLFVDYNRFLSSTFSFLINLYWSDKKYVMFSPTADGYGIIMLPTVDINSIILSSHANLIISQPEINTSTFSVISAKIFLPTKSGLSPAPDNLVTL